jgi:hypothetical protein
MRSRDTRREENQKLFRRGNERLHTVAGHQRSEGKQVVGSLNEYDVVQKPA